MNYFTPFGIAYAGAVVWPIQNTPIVLNAGVRRLARDIPAEFYLLDSSVIVKSMVAKADEFRQPPALNFGPGTKVGDSTVAGVVKQYADAYWGFRVNTGRRSIHPTLAAVAVNKIGRNTPNGNKLSEVFSSVAKYINQLTAAKREILKLYPDDLAVVNEVAGEVLARAVVILTNEMPVDNPAGILNYYTQPRVEQKREKTRIKEAAGAEVLAQKVITQRAELQVKKLIADIRKFWLYTHPQTEEAAAYVLGGKMVFLDIEEMEKYCPAGRYEIIFAAGAFNPIDRYAMKYAGAGITEVLMEQPKGPPRKIAFRGDTWIYADQEPIEDHNPLEPLEASVHRHYNNRWNSDPRVINERMVASVEGRKRLG